MLMLPCVQVSNKDTACIWWSVLQLHRRRHLLLHILKPQAKLLVSHILQNMPDWL